MSNANEQIGQLNSQLENKSVKLESVEGQVEKLKTIQQDTDRKLCQLYTNIRNTFQLRHGEPAPPMLTHLPAGNDLLKIPPFSGMSKTRPFSKQSSLSEKPSANSKSTVFTSG